MPRPQTITINTTGGQLQAVEYQDPRYPGITLYLDGQQVGVLEYHSGDGVLRFHVWQGETQDPTVSLDIPPTPDRGRSKP